MRIASAKRESVPGHVADRFAGTEADRLLVEVDGQTAQLPHPDLKRNAGAGAMVFRRSWPSIWPRGIRA